MTLTLTVIAHGTTRVFTPDTPDDVFPTALKARNEHCAHTTEHTEVDAVRNVVRVTMSSNLAALGIHRPADQITRVVLEFSPAAYVAHQAYVKRAQDGITAELSSRGMHHAFR
ncbi:hypothetical protein [Deinococcus soli (ex Cha et al. 2016)]|uniref:Uncharacterized protein n=2 Tax=Deinococcus soli (ex Cha et al. 2016) TaxID=1309411 RepID=A0ACC6KFT6_9DEIO|nr:hypothetical protein [Deinococcus soli (ex Cha et al. 2016)]MDR6218402.1 hypothetical protein [Deinococcus soli (ex Cha et al. 2016)]MDR6329142.1 hypothetical protein [Deinococcus soli (ex Cha et al. 2016)]MDR6751415.1 hypothetical protein [Deinococcus soli (ex Cha et al. 2016)]